MSTAPVSVRLSIFFSRRAAKARRIIAEMVNLIVSIHIVLTEFSVDLRNNEGCAPDKRRHKQCKNALARRIFLSWYHSLVMCGAAALSMSRFTTPAKFISTR